MRSATLILLVITAPAFAQYAQDDRLEAPKTPAEFWRAITYELNTGKYETAAYYLKGMLAANPEDQQLVELEQKEGLAAFLRLRNVPTWSADAKINDEAKKQAEELIGKVNAALEKLLGNQQRINTLIATLRGTPEERAYATRELQRSSSRAVPALIAALRNDTDSSTRATILNVLPTLPEETVGPLLASLDMKDGQLRYQILDSLSQRVDFVYLPARPALNPLPTLEYLASSANQPPEIQKFAKTLITRLRPIARSAIRAGKQELTDAALRFYRRQERFVKPDAVPVWRWEGEDLVLTPSNTSQAEEYYGLRYARWALELDPDYLPAQVTFLSMATDKAYGRVGLAADLAKAEPAVHDLLATAGATALIAALDQALIERRTTVALGTALALGERAEVKAAQPTRHQPAALVRALEYPERRVQLAAAAALVRIPGPFAQQHQVKIVDVLRRMLSAESEVSTSNLPRVLLGHFDIMKGQDLAAQFRTAGFDVVTVRTGREVMARLQKAGDIDMVALDSEIPYPPLPDLLASLRADTFAKSLPVRVLYSPDMPASKPSATMEAWLKRRTPQTMALRNDEDRQAFEAENGVRHLTSDIAGVALVPAPLTPEVLRASFAQEGGADAGSALSPEERKRYAIQAIKLFHDIAMSNPAIDLKPADRAIRQAMKDDALAKPAIEIVGRLSGREAQIDLAGVTLDSNRKPEFRLAAVQNLDLHIQRFGPVLPANVVEALVKLAGESTEPEFRGHVAAIVGVVTGEGKNTGTRLQKYQAPKPGAVPAEKPAEKETEKKPDPKDDDK